MASHEDEIYCRHCHKKEFGPKGYGFAGGAAGLAAEFKPTTSSVQKQEVNNNNESVTSNGVSAPPAPNPALAPKYAPNPNDPNSCPRCGKKVYFAEEIKSLGKKFHRLCFKCGGCIIITIMLVFMLTKTVLYQDETSSKYLAFG